MKIDSHAYIGNGIYKKQTAEDILRDMDRVGIDKSVLVPVEEFITVYNEEGNRMILSEKNAHPDRFYGFAAVNPWYGKKAEEILVKAFEEGLDGAFFVSSVQGFSINDPLVDPLMEICAKYKKPVYFHTGTPAFALPLQLAYLARRHRDVNFIMGHSGANDFVYDIDASMKDTGNLYLDTSLNYCETIFRIVKDYPDRVIFGSESPRSPLEFEYSKAARSADDPAVLEKVFSGNLLRIMEGDGTHRV